MYHIYKFSIWLEYPFGVDLYFFKPNMFDPNTDRVITTLIYVLNHVHKQTYTSTYSHNPTPKQITKVK